MTFALFRFRLRDAYLDDPNKLNHFPADAVDVINAIKAQNAQVAAGQFGGTPPVKGQQLNASIIAKPF
ncbi:hypothetical protein ACNKHO_02710 [Shigella flexneri]